ncbi:MAG: hypothetical protein ACNA8K_06645 [Cyclonatronaceae bacterium]
MKESVGVEGVPVTGSNPEAGCHRERSDIFRYRQGEDQSRGNQPVSRSN